MNTKNKLIKNSRKIISLISSCLLLSSFSATAQNPGDRAQKFRGTWWGGVHPSLLDDRLLSLKTIDGWGVGFTNGAVLSAEHFAPVPRLSGLAGADAVFPPDNDTTVQGYMDLIEDAGFMVQAYTNCENFLGNNADEFVEFAESWKHWCNTNKAAQNFINSQSYHRKNGFPERPYMFCYAEFILKHYSEQYGEHIDVWVFDDGHSMVEHGDNATSGNINDQRLYLAFADAARAGNNEIAVAFNNGRSNSNFASFPYAHATRADDFTFGHAFGGNNNHASGNQFNLNYTHVSRMTETNGRVHEGGPRSWDDNVVGHFFSKLSTTAWNFGPVQAWNQNDFNEWHEEALSAGGMMTWSGSYNRQVNFVWPWVYDLLEGTDNYLLERGISVNSEQNSRIVTLRKRNASGFGLDGGQGGKNGQNVYLWNYNASNVNQQWEEINRGNGFYSYQKAGTNFSLDGGNGGERSQNLYLWKTNTNNFNQHWKKVNIGGNIYRLEKRNAPGFSIDGGVGGSREQNVYLWSSSNTNQNMQWIIE